MTITPFDIDKMHLEDELKNIKEKFEKLTVSLEMYKTLLKLVEKDAKRYQFMRTHTSTVNWEAFPYINGHNPYDLDDEIDGSMAP